MTLDEAIARFGWDRRAVMSAIAGAVFEEILGQWHTGPGKDSRQYLSEIDADGSHVLRLATKEEARLALADLEAPPVEPRRSPVYGPGVRIRYPVILRSKRK